MGCSIQFVRLTDFTADVDVLDFSTAGYSLAIDGYFPVAAPLGARSVREVITLKLQGTSKDDLAAMTQEIDEKIKQVQWWIDTPTVERYQVWIRVQLENETYPRQAQILNIQPPDKVRLFTPEERLDNYIGSYSIGIERLPFWEDPYPYPTTTALTGLCPLAGTDTLSETINGDAPARLAKLTILESDNRVGLTDFWIGFRSSRMGTLANFVPIWGIDYGQGLSNDTVDFVDTDSYLGSVFKCDFSTTASLTARCYITMAMAFLSDTSKYADQRGTYLVLMRARMSDTSTARARIGYTFVMNIAAPPTNTIYRSPVTIANPGGTSHYHLFEMGVVSIPPLQLPLSAPLGNLGIVIDAERTSGSGSILFDSLIFIPITEGAIKVSSDVISNSSQVMTVFQNPLNAIQCYVQDSNSIVRLGTQNPIDYALPANGDSPLVVVAADRKLTTGTVAPAYSDANIDLTYIYIPRWRTLRGNST